MSEMWKKFCCLLGSFKNKTKSRPNLQLNGTLLSIICVKLANTEPCSSYNPPKDVLGNHTENPLF